MAEIRSPYRHVRLASCVDGLGHGVDEIAGDAEVAHLDAAVARNLQKVLRTNVTEKQQQRYS